MFPPRGGQECAAVNVIVSDFDEYQFVTQKEVEGILKNFGDYPLGKRFDEINMTAIEQEVEKHPMVRRAVCYQTPSGGINVEVTQRIPVFRVMSSAESYYVDDRRETMPVTVRSSAYVPVVSGNVNKEFAVGELYDFVVYARNIGDVINNREENLQEVYNSLYDKIYELTSIPILKGSNGLVVLSPIFSTF